MRSGCALSVGPVCDRHRIKSPRKLSCVTGAGMVLTAAVAPGRTGQLAEGLPEPGARRGLAKAGARAGPGNLLDKGRLTLSPPCYVTQKH